MQKLRPWWSRSMLVVGALLLLCLLVSRLLTNSELEQEPGAHGDSTIDAPALSGSLEEIKDERGQEPRAAVHDTNGVEIFGRVIDDSFGFPVPASISPDFGNGTISAGASGEFRLEPDTLNWSLLRVSALGYEHQVIPRASVRPGIELLVRLRPSVLTTVSVEFEDGAPAVGVEVVWRPAADQSAGSQIRDWIDSSVHEGGRELVRTTDSMGIVRLATGTNSLVTVRAGSQAGAKKNFLVEPGDLLRVRLPRSEASLLIVDAHTRTPLAGIELDLWTPREPSAMSQRVRSDHEGRIPILASSLPILVRRPGPLVWESELLPLGSGMTRAGPGGVSQGAGRTMVRIDAIPESRVLTIGILGCGLQLYLVDDATGDPLDVAVRVRRRNPALCGPVRAAEVSGCTALSPRSTFLDPDGIGRSKDGIVNVSCWVLNPTERPPNPPLPYDLVVTAEGRAPSVVHYDPGTARADAGPIVVQLRKAQVRRVHAHYPDGSPYRDELAFYEPREDVLCSRSRGNDGIYGPFDWSGGNILVEVEGRWELGLDPPRLESNEVVDLLIDKRLGSIVLTRIPAGYPVSELVAMSGTGPGGDYHRASTSMGAQCRFERLPAGSYLLGPKRWLEGVKLQTLQVNEAAGTVDPRASRVTVLPAKSCAVLWNPAWAAGRIIEGYVRLTGPGSTQPILTPWYSYGGAAELAGRAQLTMLGLGRKQARVPLGPDGGYCIREHDPVPTLLAVAILDETPWGGINGMHVVEVFEPGESVSIEVGSIDLHWIGAPRAMPVQVEYSISESSYQYPAKSYFMRPRMAWNTEVPLTLNGVPKQVRELLVDGKSFRVDFGADGWARIEIAEPVSETRAK
ncbi:MAG: hypothetical protein IPJ77_13220 [Planctomycetes bacterium]|nr:hypothetical protein [Planctomycetota bacterium]